MRSPRGHLFLTHVSLQVLSPYLKRIASLHWYENASPRVQVARTDLPRALPLLLPLPSLVALTRRTSDWDTASKSSREVSLQLCTKPFFWSSPLSCHNLASACGMSNVGRLLAETGVIVDADHPALPCPSATGVWSRSFALRSSVCLAAEFAQARPLRRHTLTTSAHTAASARFCVCSLRLKRHFYAGQSTWSGVLRPCRIQYQGLLRRWKLDKTTWNRAAALQLIEEEVNHLDDEACLEQIL